MLRPLNGLRRSARNGQLPGQSLAGEFNKRLSCSGAKLPKRGVGDTSNVLLHGFRRPQPAIFSTGFVQRSSAAAESQVGMWIPLVT